MPLPFTVSAIDPGSGARRGFFDTAHGRVETPVFMTVGTRATVTGLDPADLAQVGAQVLLGGCSDIRKSAGSRCCRRENKVRSIS